MNLTRTAWAAAPSLPIPDTTYPKKEPMSPPRIRHCRLPHPQSTPEQTREKTPLIRSRAKLRLSMLIKPSFHQRSRNTTRPARLARLLPPRSQHVTPVSSARRRRHGFGRGQPLTDPSPGTIPQICSPSPALAASCPPPFRFHSRAIVFFCPSTQPPLFSCLF